MADNNKQLTPAEVRKAQISIEMRELEHRLEALQKEHHSICCGTWGQIYNGEGQHEPT